MPYGGPPGWYPPPGQGFPQHPGPFPPYGYPPGPPGQFQQQQGQQNQGPKPAPIGPGAKQQTPPTETEKQSEPKSLAKPAAEMAAAAVQKAPTPPAASKPSPTEVQAAVNQPSTSQNAATAAAKSAPTGPKNRIQPAIPLQSPAAAKAPLQANSGNAAPPPTAQPNPAASLRDATQAATAAVAAAMAKLPPAGQTNGSAVDNLTRKVNEMRTNDPIRAPRQPGGGGAGFSQNRGGSRGGRGGSRNTHQKVEVPATDFDFESSNAKFNKQDLVKEAIAGSPLGENPPSTSPEADVPAGGYNKSTSFFDNISSESRDRTEAANGTTRPGGREWRGEEQKKNVETFGQGSVDNGYRGGFRGRGRGRGRGFRGRGYGGNGQPGRGGGGFRGDRGDAQTAAQ
jgi:protein LSM14